MAKTDFIDIPIAAEADLNSFEILRVWIANQQQHVNLRTDVWEDPAAWGIMLADLARHIAEAYHQASGGDRRKTLDRILLGMKVELE